MLMSKESKKENPYYSFIRKLARDERVTINGLADKYSLGRGFSSAVYRIRHDPFAKLHPETVGKIEKQMDIKIDDTDINNITYRRKDEPTLSHLVDSGAINVLEEELIELPLIEVRDMQSIAEIVKNAQGKIDIERIRGIASKKVLVPYKSSNAYVGKVASDFNEPFFVPGDLLVSDLDLQIVNNDFAGVILKSGLWFVGQYSQREEIITISFYNRKYPPQIFNISELSFAAKIVKVIREL